MSPASKPPATVSFGPLRRLDDHHWSLGINGKQVVITEKQLAKGPKSFGARDLPDPSVRQMKLDEWSRLLSALHDEYMRSRRAN